MEDSPFSQNIANTSSNGILAGYLRPCNANAKPSADLRIHRDEGVLAVYRDEEAFIGRDQNRCHLVVQDPAVSNKHCRIYSIVYDDQIEPLIYIEDLSSNGTYWNGSLLGRGNEGALLCNGDTIRISPRISYTYEAIRTFESESVDDIQEAEKRLMRHLYRVTERKLGAGAYGQVYLAISLAQQQQLACKIVNLRKLRLKEEIAKQERTKRNQKLRGIVPRKSIVDQRVNRTFREVEILKDLDHPNIIRLEKVFKSVNTLFIFEELITGGDLFSYIDSKGGHGLRETDAAVIVRQIVEALKYLHEKDVAHRDIKPDNILMTCSRNPPRVVLTDFGHAIKIACSSSRIQRMLTTVGTLDYVAPEVHGKNKTVSGQGYTKAVDMWSLGTVTSAVLTGRSIFAKSQASYQTPSIETAIIEAAAMCDLQELDGSGEWERISDQGKDFVKKLLVLDEKDRMTAVQALEHDWLTSEELKSSSDNLYQQALKNWKPRCRAPIDLISDLELYANAQKSYVKTLLPWKKKRPGRPIEPHYQPPHQQVYHLLSQRRQHTKIPSIAEYNIEPPNIEKLQIAEDTQRPVEESTPVETIIPDSKSVLVENAFKANSQKLLNEESPEETRFINHHVRNKLVRPTSSSTRRRFEARGGMTAASPSRKSRRRSIFDMEEDGTDPVPVNHTIQIPSSPRLSPFAAIKWKRKYTPGLGEAESFLHSQETPLQQEPLYGSPMSKKRAKKSFVNATPREPPDSIDEVSRYFSSSKTSAGQAIKIRQGLPAQSGIQLSLEQDSTLIIPPPGFSRSHRIHSPQVSDSEENSDVQEMPSSVKSSIRPQRKTARRVSSSVNSAELELHEHVGKKTRTFRTAKSYGRDVVELRKKLAEESQKEKRTAVSGDLTDSIRTAC